MAAIVEVGGGLLENKNGERMAGRAGMVEVDGPGRQGVSVKHPKKVIVQFFPPADRQRVLWFFPLR